MMSIYLHDIPLAEAQERLLKALEEAGLDGVIGEEEIPVDENAAGRTLAREVWAKISSPHYHAAAMDGFAVVAGETDQASPGLPVTLSDFEYIDTGDPLPEGFNAVIPIEEVESLSEGEGLADDARSPDLIRVRAAAPPWRHVRPMGEDMVATQLVLAAGHVLRPVDLGAIAGSGNKTVTVARKPRVAVLPTGSELVEIGTPVKVGDIIEYNSVMLAAQIEEWGGAAERFPIISDDVNLIRDQVRKAAEKFDLVLLNAGSSAGSEDYSSQVIEELGQMLVHGVAVRPGHPVILGMLRKENDEVVPVIGVPGYPVSAALTGEIFVRPLIDRWLGRRPEEVDTIQAELTRKIASPAGDDDFVRVVVGRVGERLLAAPVSRGAGVISSLVRADGIVVLPRGSQGETAGTKVNVRLYRKRAELEKTIFVIGSHDLTLDLIAKYLGEYDRRLVSAHVGSLGGLTALRRGEAHLAGAHLLDTESGEFNLPYIKKYLPGQAVKVIGLVTREQGLIVPQGNPKNIISIEDLAREDVRFINRQRGAGTRLLLDHHIGLHGIAPTDVVGYDQEEYTHLSAAAAVASGRGDCALGIAAAAQALEMDFVTLFSERYDLIIPGEHFGGPLVSPLLEILNRADLKKEIDQLAGYGTEPLGKLIASLE